MTTIALHATSSAASRYDNFDFECLLTVGNTTFGIDAAGLHRMGGDTDDGEAITGRITTDWTAPAGERVCRCDRLTLAYTGMRVVAEATDAEGGDAASVRYELPAQTADAPRPGVVKLGKGPASRFWKFSIVTVGAARIEALALAPLPLTRTR